MEIQKKILCELIKMSTKNGKNLKRSSNEIVGIENFELSHATDNEPKVSCITNVTPTKESNESILIAENFTPLKKIKQEYNPDMFNTDQTEESFQHLESLYSANKTNKKETVSKNATEKKGKVTAIEATALTCTFSGVTLIAGLIVYNSYAIRNFLKGQEMFGDRFAVTFIIFVYIILIMYTLLQRKPFR